MTITNTPYCSTQELVIYIGKTTTTDDDLLSKAVAAATAAIDDFCGRVFSNDDTASARVFEPWSMWEIRIDDFHTTSGLIVATDDDDDGTFETTWSASDYEIEPFNGNVSGISGFPYWTIRSVSNRRFPTCIRRRGTVQVTAKWGWSAIPNAVKQAALILAQEYFRLRDAPFGVAGVDAFGPIRVRDNHAAKKLLEPYVRHDRRGLVAG